MFKSRSARLQLGFKGQINVVLKYMHLYMGLRQIRLYCLTINFMKETLNERSIVHNLSTSIIHNRNVDLFLRILSLEGVIVTYT